MFCSSCGKEVQEEWSTCPHCGNTLKKKVNMQKEIHTGKAKKKPKVLWIILGVIVVIIIGMSIAGSDDSKPNTSDEQEIIDKLQTFTTVYKEDGKYYFLDNEEDWVLTYTSGNEFVSFENATVVECFTEAFGEGCFAVDSASDHGFSYDLSDNEARIYFDVDIEDGHLTIVNYNLTDKKYEVMIDGDKWGTTDVFTDYVNKYGIDQSIESDVEDFKDLLQQHGLTIDDLLCIKFDTLETQMIPGIE